MQSDISLNRVKMFPRLMWILLFGAFITRGSFYMIWPFLALILYEKFLISATQVGLILSIAAMVSVLIGFIGGALSDRIGRQRLMYASGILYIVSFSMLAQTESLVGYVVVITLCSIAKALWEPPTSALIGDIIPDSKTRELAMQARYFVVNVGAALGPLAGVWLGLTGQQSSFYITAIAFALFLVVLMWGMAKQSEQMAQPKPSTFSWGQTFTLLRQDKVLQYLILSNIICMFIYGQMDSTLVQFLRRANVPDILLLISTMILANALVIISLQFVLLKMMASLVLTTRIQIGVVLLAIGQLWFALNPLNFYWGWMGAVVVMSIAEAILFPTMNVHIDRLAPDNLRGAYFGAASFYSLGYALAPIGGGILLDVVGGHWLYGVMFVACFVVIMLYRRLERLSQHKGQTV